MEHVLFHQMSQLEEVHWWFVSRRAILDAVIKQLPLSDQAAILEAGCGTGGNLAMLSAHGTVSAMEYDSVAREMSISRGIGMVAAGSLPDAIPFEPRKFEMIALFDVLEHLDEDVASLQALRHRLKSDGWLILTVPANPWMWSHHDEIHHHRRRYTLRHLRRVVKNAGYEITYVSYFNFLLFPLIATIRLLQKMTGKHQDDGDLTLPSKLANKTLTSVFSFEKHIMANQISIPFGVSLVLTARPTFSCLEETV
ncbi:MAG: class I SAM-dependent methyltransferase [Leptolyngbyaceae cyanobacterium]